MSDARLRWRFFWSRRSFARTIWALVCALIALLAAVYLALPIGAQGQILQALQQVGQSVGSEGVTITLEVALAAFAALSITLLLAPGYRQYRYLTIPTSLIAPISVYIDAENLPESLVNPMTTFLRKFLDGRRADLLYFMDAKAEATKSKYKTLYRYGFRPVDVPHNPVGTKKMYEAVDRELAMHAFERALVGPAGQEFIIVSSDGDFAPLVYRLAGLGHRVQIWSASNTTTYHTLARYLPITLVNLSQVMSELNSKPTPAQTPGSAPPEKPLTDDHETTHRSPRPRLNRRRRPQRASRPPFYTHAIPPANLSVTGEENIYYAIAETQQAYSWCEAHYLDDEQRVEQLLRLLNTRLLPRITGVGYSSESRNEYWLSHLTSLGVFVSAPDHTFPVRGRVSAETAARQLYAVTRAMGQAATRATSSRPDGLINMQVVLAQFDATRPGADGATPLSECLSQTNGRRFTHTRYLVGSARALGVMQYDDVPSTADLIANPRLILPDEPDAPQDIPGDQVKPDGE